MNKLKDIKRFELLAYASFITTKKTRYIKAGTYITFHKGSNFSLIEIDKNNNVYLISDCPTYYVRLDYELFNLIFKPIDTAYYMIFRVGGVDNEK